MADSYHAEGDASGQRVGTDSSVTHNIADLVLNHDPAPGFIAATAHATSKAPTLKEIRRGSFGEDGWSAQQHAHVDVEGWGSGSGSSKGKRRSWSGSSVGRKKGSRDSVKGTEGHGNSQGHGGAVLEPFAPLTEEPTRISEDAGQQRREEVGADRLRHLPKNNARTREDAIKQPKQAESQVTPTHSLAIAEEDDPNEQPQPKPNQRVYSSGYIPPPTLPWTTSTAIALKAFSHWFLTPFGFLVTLYGLNVVAWGGMLFLLLCNASPYMCHAPIPTPANREKMSPAAALGLPGPYYVNCNDINSPRRVWIEIDSQILNALFCVTGFGLVPWRFRDLYYILRYRFASTRKQGLQGKMYGLRVLAGIHRGWFRLPGSETLDTTSTPEYLDRLEKEHSSTIATAPNYSDLENNTPTHDPRIPLPFSKAPAPPATSIRAPPTQIWLMDFFIWCQVWNTFFQCCLCGFMWGMDRYDRPPWSTGLFVALACGIAGVGGVVSFVQGKRVKRVEGVASSSPAGIADAAGMVEGGDALVRSRTAETGRESLHVGDKDKMPDS